MNSNKNNFKIKILEIIKKIMRVKETMKHKSLSDSQSHFSRIDHIKNAFISSELIS